MMVNFCSIFLAAFLLISSVSGEVVSVSTCRNEQTNCTINEVRITPCKEASKNKACKLKRGETAEISFDFTPNFDATTLTGDAFWTGGLTDIAWTGMNKDACSFTECPIKKDEKRTYTYQLEISKKYPINSYNVKWILENENKEKCCLIAQIKIVK